MVQVIATLSSGQDARHEKQTCINIGRQRVLEFKKPALQAFSPTRAGWHVPTKFGKLVKE